MSAPTLGSHQGNLHNLALLAGVFERLERQPQAIDARHRTVGKTPNPTAFGVGVALDCSTGSTPTSVGRLVARWRSCCRSCWR